MNPTVWRIDRQMQVFDGLALYFYFNSINQHIAHSASDQYVVVFYMEFNVDLSFLLFVHENIIVYRFNINSTPFSSKVTAVIL